MERLLPILIAAPADAKTRGKWLTRLSTAICDDGVDFLCQVREEWGKICSEAVLINEWADRLLPIVRQIMGDTAAGAYLSQTVMCLSACRDRTV